MLKEVGRTDNDDKILKSIHLFSEVLENICPKLVRTFLLEVGMDSSSNLDISTILKINLTLSN